MMRKKIENLLSESPGIKAKIIAKKLNLDKAEVNSFLYDNPEYFQIDTNYCWTLNLAELRIELAGNCWVDCRSFEKTLAVAGSPIDSNIQSIIFIIPEGCQLLLEVIARFMALSNQLVHYGKHVTIDCTFSTPTFTYLNRLGFFDHLNKNVIVLPEWPKTSAASVYKGNSDNVVEIGAIDPIDPDESIPEQLKERFVYHAGSKYMQTAFTIISEPFNNVREHSESPISGFVALQFYSKHGKYPAHIQTVISDSGKGIIGTLWPILAKRYPKVFKQITDSNSSFEELLLKMVFTKGEISQSEDPGRGLGLKSSSAAASKFDATILVRQECCEGKFTYRSGLLHDFKFQNNMPRILGTHVCFDFLLDQNELISLN